MVLFGLNWHALRMIAEPVGEVAGESPAWQGCDSRGRGSGVSRLEEGRPRGRRMRERSAYRRVLWRNGSRGELRARWGQDVCRFFRDYVGAQSERD